MGKALHFPQTSHRSGDGADSIPWDLSEIHAGMQSLLERLGSSDTPARKALREKVASLTKQFQAAKERYQRTREDEDIREASKLGMWTAWTPLALPQCWPFCWWVAVVIDHFSRRAMDVAVFKNQPTAVQVRTFLGRLTMHVGRSP